jgi:hypothetical protein
MSAEAKSFAELVQEYDAHLDDRDRAVEEHQGFTFGQRVRVLEDDDDNGIWEGAEGVLIIEQVGSETHGSLRTGLFLLEEGMAEPNEVQADNIEPA